MAPKRSPDLCVQWETRTAADTRALGRRLGERARAGDFIACCGALGAGKTTWIQGLAEGLAVDAEAYVRSPTFTLMNLYQGRLLLYHFDFYRLSHPYEALDIGFEEYCEAEGVVVEWADKFPELLPARRLEVHLELRSADTRVIRGLSYGRAYHRYLAPFAVDET